MASWAGICPGNNESAGKRKSAAIRKGNRWVRRILCEAAQAAAKTESQFKGRFKGLTIARGRKRAIIAIAHKILRICFALLKSRGPYKDPEID
ncbi:MAG: transposase, partial [Deltaproteobacteria bacterium]|nr:transposase [Deltaproteobacteria bacterium]